LPEVNNITFDILRSEIELMPSFIDPKRFKIPCSVRKPRIVLANLIVKPGVIASFKFLSKNREGADEYSDRQD
jgi:hypothetical protein